MLRYHFSFWFSFFRIFQECEKMSFLRKIQNPINKKTGKKMVSEGSPADDAGLNVEDLVIEFETQNC